MRTTLDLPGRTGRPRTTGLTMMIDNGLPQGQFRDVLDSHCGLVDLVKLGWGTALVTARLQGVDVNLGNIAPTDLVALETLRLGLRSDTMLDVLPEHRTVLGTRSA